MPAVGAHTGCGRRRRAPLRFPAPNSNVAATKVFRLGGTTGGSNITYHTLTYSEARFAGGVLMVVNGLSAAITIDGVAVAPTAAPNDNLNPLDAAGSPQGWTYLSGGPWTVSAAPVAGTGGAVPSVLKIPFALNSIDRTDIAGAPCLLMVRIHAATPISAATPSTAEMNGIASLTGGVRRQVGYHKSQTLATFNVASNFTTPTQQFIGPLAVSFDTSVKSYAVLILGDSTHQGAGSTSNYWGAAARAAAVLSTLSRPVSIINCGFQGQTLTQTFAAAETWIGAHAPQAVLIPIYSVNNTPTTQAAADATLQQAFALAAKCKVSGIKPFLVAPNPAGSLSLASDNIRKQVTLNAKAGPFIVMDIGAAVGNGASPERIVAGYTLDDTHCNDAGYDRQDTLAVRPALSAWLDAQP